MKYFGYCLLGLLGLYTGNFLLTGCAQVGVPTGGPKDSLAPVLLSAQPKEKTLRFSGNKIVLTFDEYVEAAEIQTNVTVSPLPRVMPVITSKLKTITIKLKDSLLENTTYAINFGNSIRDINENNPYKNYTYVFSTGDVIDSLEVTGKVVLAESGKLDTTLNVLLYRDVPDSAVESQKPNYQAKLDGKGNFRFTNLAAGVYKIYALKDGDGGKTYNSPIELFAFNDESLTVGDSTNNITLYAYAEEKDTKPAGTSTRTTTAPRAGADKKLKYTVAALQSNQSLLAPLEISFATPLKDLNQAQFILTDTLYKPVVATRITLDSTRKIVSVQPIWTEEFDYRLLIGKDAAEDTFGNRLAKSDTIRFRTKSKSDYGNLLIRFSNLDTAKHPVLQLFKADEMVRSAAITTASWNDRMMEPGEYEIRILYDRNNNGKWDPGNYKARLQPERAITVDKKITVKANWDNEKEVAL